MLWCFPPGLGGDAPRAGPALHHQGWCLHPHHDWPTAWHPVSGRDFSIFFFVLFSVAGARKKNVKNIFDTQYQVYRVFKFFFILFSVVLGKKTFSSFSCVDAQYQVWTFQCFFFGLVFSSTRKKNWKKLSVVFHVSDTQYQVWTFQQFFFV